MKQAKFKVTESVKRTSNIMIIVKKTTVSSDCS